MNYTDKIPTTLKAGPFNLSIFIGQAQTLIKVMSDTNKIYSSDYSNVEETLIENLPGVFTTTCFNPGNKSFKEEAKDTEIAHLFEHMFLKHFCDIKEEKGECDCECAGFTQWDWHKEKTGTFNIWLNVGVNDKEEINVALERSSNLLKEIIRRSEAEDDIEDIIIFPVPAPIYAPAR